MAIDTAAVDVSRDIVFGQAGDKDLLCDVYRPAAGVSKHTALIHLHGGGFRGGSKAGARVAAPLAALGYLGVSIDYRLSGDVKWPAQIEDTKAAIRWVRSNAASPDIEPAKVALVGYSPGGLMALIAAATPNAPELEGTGGSAGAGSEVAACVVLYPVASRER